MTKALTIAMVADHPLIMRAVEGEIAQHYPLEAAVHGRHVAEILNAGADFDLVILDLRLDDGTDPADNVRLLTGRGWPVLLYTAGQNPGVVARCFRAGARGIVGKSDEAEDLVAAVGFITSGEPYLSSDWAAALDADASVAPDLAPREAEALRLYATGLPLKSVARRMGISINTAKTYLMDVRRAYDEVGRPAATKTALYLRAVEDGIIDPPDPAR